MARPETPRATPVSAKEKRKATPEEVATLLKFVNALFPPAQPWQVREGTLRVLAGSPGALHGTKHDWDADPNGAVLVPQLFLPSPELDLRMSNSAPIPSGSTVVAQRRQQNPLDGDVRWEKLSIHVGGLTGVGIVFMRCEAPGQSAQERLWQLHWDDLASASAVRFTALLSHTEWEDETALPVKFRRAVGRGAHRGYEPTSDDMAGSIAWRALQALARAGLEPVVLAAIEAAAKED